MSFEKLAGDPAVEHNAEPAVEPDAGSPVLIPITTSKSDELDDSDESDVLRALREMELELNVDILGRLGESDGLEELDWDILGELGTGAAVSEQALEQRQPRQQKRQKRQKRPAETAETPAPAVEPGATEPTPAQPVDRDSGGYPTGDPADTPAPMRITPRGDLSEHDLRGVLRESKTAKPDEPDKRGGPDEPDKRGEPDAEAVAFRQAQSNLRKAPGDLEARAQFREALRLRRQTQALRWRAESESGRRKRYRRLRGLGYTPGGARWEIEQDAAAAAAAPAEEAPVCGITEDNFAPYIPLEIGDQHTAFEWIMLAAGLDPNAPWVSIQGDTMSDAATRETRMLALVPELWLNLKQDIEDKEVKPVSRGYYRTIGGFRRQDLTTSVFDAETMAAFFTRVGGYGEKISAWLSQHTPKSEITEISDEEREQQETGAPNTGTDRTEIVPPSRHASRVLIDQIITEVYDEEAKNNRKPPNILEIATPVQNKLKALGFEAAGNQIQEIAYDPKHAARRGKPGQTMASKKRRAAIDAN
jgi:hypothetical protein